MTVKKVQDPIETAGKEVDIKVSADLFTKLIFKTMKVYEGNENSWLPDGQLEPSSPTF